MDILFFGRLGDVAKNMSVPCPENVVDTDSLATWLGIENEALAAELNKPGNRIAVNKTIIMENTSVTDEDEVAFMSPLSGG